MKKVKMIIKKLQLTKAKKSATIWDNAKKTLTKTLHKKKKSNNMFDTSTAIYEDKDCILLE